MSCEMHAEARRLLAEQHWGSTEMSDEEIDRLLEAIGNAGKTAAEAMRELRQAVLKAAQSVGYVLGPVLVELKEKYPEAFDDA